MCTVCSFLTPSSPPPPILSTYLWPPPCARGPAAIQQHNPQFMPLAVETNTTPILAQTPIHRLAFARPVADKMQLTFPNSLSPSTLLLVQPGQPHTQSPQFKANIPPLEQSIKPLRWTTYDRTPHLPDRSIKTTNVIGTGYGFGLP